LAVIANEDDLENITPNKILKNLNQFFLSINSQFNDLNASENEKKYAKKKLKQHLDKLYTTNHYLHGINNISKYLINVKLCSNSNHKFLHDLKELNLPVIIKKENIVSHEISLQIYLANYSYLKKEEFEKLLAPLKNYDFQIKSYKKAPVEFNEEYFNSFKDEIIKILTGTSKILNDECRLQKNNLCNFCGRKSSIVLSKDLFPLTSALGDFNHGIVHICQYCYLASIVSFFNFINVRSEEKSSGIYFFYHFSKPQVMIEYSKRQIKYLQNNSMSSLQTIIGGKYSSVFKDLYEKIKYLKSIEKYSPSLTIYFLLNDNRGAIYENISLPSGLLNFWLGLQSSNLQKEWGLIYSKLKESEYIKFVNGEISIYRLFDNQKQTIILYLEEVLQMEENKINICEELSKNLVLYFKEKHNRNSNHRKNWIEEFHDFFALNKSYELFNNILQMNNEYFRWTEGKNLISISSIKTILEDNKKYNLFYGLIEYFILNSLNDEERIDYFNYIKKKENM
jgi:hypothetical protein